jgi:SH3-like domain-containing protein
MTISLSASLRRLLLCGMVVASPVAMAQTPTTNTPAAPHKAPPAQTPPVKPPPTHKPPPVVQPHGPTHALKPPPAKPVVSKPAVAPPTPAPAPAEPPKQPDADTSKGSVTSLPTPRFVSLRSEEVNLRSGPGTRYPIDWVYKRRDLPVEILREFDVWRLVQDQDGTKGWVHQATLTGRRSFMITGADATLRRDPRDDASPVAVLKAGVIGQLRSCQAGSAWCQVQAGGYRGYLRRNQFWGALPDEVVGNS